MVLEQKVKERGRRGIKQVLRSEHKRVDKKRTEKKERNNL